MPNESSGRPVLICPAYELAFERFVWKVSDSMLDADGILGEIDAFPTRHAGPTRNVPGPQPFDQRMKTFKHPMTISNDQISSSDIEAVTEFVAEFNRKRLKSLMEELFATVSGVSEAVGTAKKLGGKRITYDDILDTLEETEFQFDDAGNPEPKQFICGPDVKCIIDTLEFTPEHRRRHDTIMDKKREEWNAQKRTRRLPR